jgi:hypothetical protein
VKATVVPGTLLLAADRCRTPMKSPTRFPEEL